MTTEVAEAMVLLRRKASAPAQFIAEAVEERERWPKREIECSDSHRQTLSEHYFELACLAERDGDGDYANRYLEQAVDLLN